MQFKVGDIVTPKDTTIGKYSLTNPLKWKYWIVTAVDSPSEWAGAESGTILIKAHSIDGSKITVSSAETEHDVDSAYFNLYFRNIYKNGQLNSGGNL